MDHGSKRNVVAAGDLVFAPDEKKAANDEGHWNILIVDDDKDVHDVTELALRNFAFEAKPLRFFHAYTGAEALQTMADNPDIAVIFLDVVMESDDAGLTVAKRIRTDLGNSLVRIVLRTGQPGLAPAQEVIISHEINDYKTKTELTAQKLFTTLVGSLRNYRDLLAIENNRKLTSQKLLTTFAGSLRNYRDWIASDSNRRGLEKIVTSSGSWFEMPSMEQFIEGVLSQAKDVLRERPDAVPSLTKQATAAADSNANQARQAMPAFGQTTKSEPFAEAEYSEYESTSFTEMLAILRGMGEAGSLVTLYFNQGDDFLLTSLIQVSPDGKTIIFDYGSDMEVNRKALQAKKINCVSSKERVKIQFSLNGVRPVEFEGRTAFLSDVPDSLFRLQRREYYRLTTPMANPLRAIIPVPHKDGSIKTLQAVVFNISCGGICLVVPPGGVPPKMDKEFSGVSINLPSIGIITFDTQVRNIYDITTSDGKILQRVGCEFIKLPGPMMKLIQRYIVLIAHERKARGI